MAGLIGHKPDNVGDYWSKKESICDHTIAIVTNIDINRGTTFNTVTRMYIHPVRIKASLLESQLPALFSRGGSIFKDDKLIFCPECGEKIDWKEIEAKIGEINGKNK